MNLKNFFYLFLQIKRMSQSPKSPRRWKAPISRIKRFSKKSPRNKSPKNDIADLFKFLNIKDLAAADIAAEVQMNFKDPFELGKQNANELFRIYGNNLFRMNINQLVEAGMIPNTINIATFNILLNYYPAMHNDTRQLRLSDILKMGSYNTFENFRNAVIVDHKNLSEDEISYAFGFFNVLYNRFSIMKKKKNGKEKLPLFDVVEMDEDIF